MKNRNTHGFTLVEILLVIGLIGLIMGVVITNIGKVSEDAEIAMTKTLVTASLKTPLLSYKNKHGKYPSTAEGLQVLVDEEYVEEFPIDPWKNKLKYRYPGTKRKSGYDLYSLGPDGVESEDDITNWKK